MRSSEAAQGVRKWSRHIHRELSYFFAGMVFVYALSGIMMNHRDSFNPHFSVKRTEYVVPSLPPQGEITKSDVLALLEPLGESEHYTKHYFPQPTEMKVFLKGGSSLVVDLTTRKAVYEKLTRRPLLSAVTTLHYNPGKGWTIFADCFAVSLMVITLTGVVMVRGRKGLIGRGGLELLAGILIPLLLYLL